MEFFLAWKRYVCHCMPKMSRNTTETKGSKGAYGPMGFSAKVEEVFRQKIFVLDDV